MGKLINDRYELDDLSIRRGGMGDVWFGRDIKLDRPVAVKFIRFPDGEPDRDQIRRFVRESRITARLEHSGVPAVYDVGTHEGRPYLVMQRVDGISVADLVAEQGALPIGWAAGITAQVCSVLTAAHQASLVHRDLKPSNLMLQPDGAVKVLDFGLAAAPTLTDFSKITATGVPLGTPAYMAPEQIQANISGPATDLYALGCTLHEMLTGERLFDGSTSYEVWSKQVSHEPARVRDIRPDVPAELEDLLLHLLQKKPEDRPANAQVVYERLLPYVTDLRLLPGVLRPPTAVSPTRMYATVLSRVFAPGPSAPAPASARVPSGGQVARRARPATAPARPSDREAAETDRAALRQARAKAHRLATASRYGQAVEVLAAAVEPASATLGRTDRDVITARIDLADAMFEAGDYRQAAPAYEDLARDIGQADGPHAEPALHSRLRAATCRALLSDTSEALRQLQSLLRDQNEAFGASDPRNLDLRRQIGLLQIGAGQRQAAEQTLSQLRDDMARLRSASHPSVKEITDLLSGLRRHSR